MPNERLRVALREHGLTPFALATEVGVDPKTVERWINKGRTPYRRLRYQVATKLGVDENYLWPDAIPREQVAVASESEVINVYPHRSEVPRDVWDHFFRSAQNDIGILVYAGGFLAEDARLTKTIGARIRAGVRFRLLVGDPDSANMAEWTLEEGTEGAMAHKIRSGLVWYRQKFFGAGQTEIRLHGTVLYNSVFRADDELLVNTQVHGTPASMAPVWHLRRVAGGEIWSMYAQSFEDLWGQSTPLPED